MPDREKVISDLEKITDEANPWKESPPVRCDLPYPLLLEAHERLKEQEKTIDPDTNYEGADGKWYPKDW